MLPGSVPLDVVTCGEFVVEVSVRNTAPIVETFIVVDSSVEVDVDSMVEDLRDV